jgi:hypothetical protein
MALTVQTTLFARLIPTPLQLSVNDPNDKKILKTISSLEAVVHYELDPEGPPETWKTSPVVVQNDSNGDPGQLYVFVTPPSTTSGFVLWLLRQLGVGPRAGTGNLSGTIRPANQAPVADDQKTVEFGPTPVTVIDL